MKELKDLVAGDKVVIKHKNDEGTIIYVATIERITRHYIYAIGVRFCKRNGKMIGEKSGSRTHIEIASEEVIIQQFTLGDRVTNHPVKDKIDRL